MQQVRVNTRLSFGSAQPSNVAQFSVGALTKYLTECQQRQVRSLETISYHVQILLPYIGSMRLRDVCNDSLEAFKDERVAEDKVKNVTVNRSLEVVRTVLNRAARVWRMNGKPWLSLTVLVKSRHYAHFFKQEGEP